VPTRLPAARFVVAAVACWLIAQPHAIGQIPPYGGAREYVADLAARRARVMEALGPDSILVLWAAPPRVYSTDVNYEYRQDSNFFYLTGLNEEGAVLVLVPGSRTRREFLFAPQGTPSQELWTGHVPTAAELMSDTGIANVHLQKASEEFDAFLAGLLSGKGYGSSSEPAATEFGEFFKAVEAGRARLGVLDRLVTARPGESRPVVPPPGSAAAKAIEIQRRHSQLSPFNATDIFTRLRQIKTPYEQRLLRRSVEISAEAHVEGMKAARPGRWEYEVEAAIEYWYLKNGALSWGYPSIVGSGPNATTLHYLKSTRQMRNGDLLLVDAAANFQGLTGDITRTYPVSGRFSPEQRAIYELVLRAQDAGRAAATPGARAQAISAAIREVFASGLQELGLVVPGAKGLPVPAQVSLWFPHGPTHGIGIDVHDPLGPLDPGAAFVIEPGLYIRADRLDTIPKTPENLGLIEKLTPAMEKYRDIGVRIEDSFLMTPTGVESLSAKAPRTVRDIERVVGTGR
jgi:Xaa-Pro aminopeptidase